MKYNTKRVILVSSLLFLFSPFRVFAGNITGIVTVKGLRSPANILVYLVEAPPVEVDLSRAGTVMDQRNLAFIPHILPILAGATVQFPNNDQVNHNVFSLSRAKKFNLGSYSSGESKSVTFGRPGAVQLRCDVHAEMAAYIMVMKNPYFAVTNDQGRFIIPDSKHIQRYSGDGLTDIPPGKYVLKTWHEKLKSHRQIIELPETGEVAVQLNLSRGVPSVLYK